MPDSKKTDSEHALIRKELRQRRQALSQKQQEVAAEQLCSNLLADPDYQAADTVAFYLPFDGEISPLNILSHAFEQGKTCCLPVLDAVLPELHFVECRTGAVLQSNRYGIEEPAFNTANLVPPAQLDIIFLPLVAFDLQGTRLGMGKGYYDRTLSAFKASGLAGKPLLIGLAHECQRVAHLERADWDVPLDRIVTDQSVYFARS